MSFHQSLLRGTVTLDHRQADVVARRSSVGEIQGSEHHHQLGVRRLAFGAALRFEKPVSAELLA